MPRLNKTQTARALALLTELSQTAPEVVTAREAVELCARYGVEARRWSRVPAARYNFEPVALAAVAVEIASKEGK